MRTLILLGSTGSIGTQTLEILAQNPGKFRLHAIAAGGGQSELFARQISEFKPEYAAIAKADPSWIEQLKQVAKAAGTTLLIGAETISEVAGLAGGPDTVVVNGINGAIGLEPTLAALRAGSTLALANKESLVVAGPLTKRAMVRPGQIVPVDSEHSAIAQCLRAGNHRRGLTVDNPDGTTDVAKLILTASGGPFRGKTRAELADITPEQALRHPTWQMGPVVTINSSTLANKALEVAEAQLLFDIDARDIQTVIHPASIVHSMVQFQDGSILAQASPPTMLLPIALGLSWPQRLESIAPACDFSRPQAWEFMPVDDQVFPAISLMRECLLASDAHPAVFNWANEICVQAFRDGRIGYLQIIDTVQEVCAAFSPAEINSMADLQAINTWSEAATEAAINAGSIPRGI